MPPLFPALGAAAALPIVGRTRLPSDLEVGAELGKGSNNKVFAAIYKGEDCVLRVPRRRSDTQQRGSATWEFRHTLRAAQLGVGPAIYAAWLARHANAKQGWTAGLYLVSERLDGDLDAVLSGALREQAEPHREEIASALVRCLHALSEELIYVYDLKPSNVMVRLPPRAAGNKKRPRIGQAEVKIIDFGRDFCEWGGGALAADDPDVRHPVIDMLRRRIRARGDVDVDAIVKHVLFASMLVQMAATTTHCLSADRADHRMSAAERARANVVAPFAAKLLDGMQGKNIALVRHVLRVDDVRGVLRHYHGRRNAGTRRTFRLARGVELLP